MLSLNQIALRRGTKRLVHGVTLQVHAGQRLGIIGANGSGKSSLFAMLLGDLEADDGSLELASIDTISHVAQESPDSEQPAIDYVIDGDAELRDVQAAIGRAESDQDNNTLHGLYERLETIDGYSAEARAGRLLHGLGFAPESIQDPVRSFSGGWRMRLNLARALMCRADLLLLDEPTNHLDLPAILWLERWLQRYEGILLVISHDRDFLDEVCTRIAHIEHEMIKTYTGNYSDFEKLRAEQLALQQAMHAKQQKEIKHIQSYVDRFRYKASKAKQAQSRIKMLERMTVIAPAHVDSPFHFRFSEPKKQPQHLLNLMDADVGYADSDTGTVLSGIRLNISAGDRIGLLGVNGAGKSTLVKALSTGSTMLSGDRILSKDTVIGYFAQHQLDLLHPEQSPMDHLRQYKPHDRESDQRRYLGRFGFGGERIFDPVAPFSGGEKARLVLALMISQEPNLLLLDEPTNHLDLEMRQALSVALIEYTGALVVISHDRHLLRSVCDELLIVHDGIVDRFDRSLDDYQGWLKEQKSIAEEPSSSIDTSTEHEKSLSKKERRRQDAERRQRLKPLNDKVQHIERELTDTRQQLAALEGILNDEAIYADPERHAELANHMKERNVLKEKSDALEWEWLEASEALEKAG